jgi:hypothetical protein
MADRETKRAPQHAKLVSFDDDYEIEYWTRKFDVCRERLAEAVAAVGHSAANVGAYLDEDTVADG